MAYRANPFLERVSERTTSDQEFVRLFSPKVLDRLPSDVFDGALHIFRSPPGGGKTTLLRAFTPSALKAFFNARRPSEMTESHRLLMSFGAIDDETGPRLLGVLLSCASGYADLPPGMSSTQEGLFRALFDCRVVLRTLRSLSLALGLESTEQLSGIELEYQDSVEDLKHIPLTRSAAELLAWAEQHERAVYTQLDAMGGAHRDREVPAHVRFESVLWLQGVNFWHEGKLLGLSRLLMIDDVQKLRRKQRQLLLEELAELRPKMPVWLAERSIALGDELLSQGVREGRDVRQYSLEEIWASGSKHQFMIFAENILERRLEMQVAIPAGAFSQYLRDHLLPVEASALLARHKESITVALSKYRDTVRYIDWLEKVDSHMQSATLEDLQEVFVTLILVARDQAKRQLSLQLNPLPTEELESRDSAQVQGAADIFLHEYLELPHYFGIERLCAMATNNVEELLSLAASLYEGLQARQVLRKPELLLSPSEQEKLLRGVAKKRREFIPKSHTEGARAQRLLDAIGSFCRERTFQPNAPYAPGVTGVRLSQTELARLTSAQTEISSDKSLIRRVLSECVAENLLFTRASSASTGRDSGTVFYLNRMLCANYGLPLQLGGWQDVDADEITEWVHHGRRQQRLGIN